MSDVVITKGTTVDQDDIAINVAGAGVVLVVDITAGAGSLVVTINGVTSSGYRYPLLVSESLSGVSTTPLRIFPGATPSENAVANDLLPSTIEVTVEVTGSVTYGIDMIASE